MFNVVLYLFFSNTFLKLKENEINAFNKNQKIQKQFSWMTFRLIYIIFGNVKGISYQQSFQIIGNI